MKYELITPTRKIVEQFNSFWTEGSKKDWEVSLFQNQEKLNIRDLIPEEEFQEMGKADEQIRKMVKGQDSQVLKRINAVYHTRINTELIIKDLEWNQLMKNDVDWFVGFCREKIRKYPYSFATKVYSFVHEEKEPRQYPIFDSIVVTLLDYYLDKSDEIPPKKDWGTYENYQKAYSRFAEKYGLIGIPYKQIDIFLWTYGIALQRYWEELGILKFETVTYKPKQ